VIVRYIDSRTREHQDTILGWLLQELPDARLALISTGYFDAALLDWTQPHFETILDHGGEVHFVVGSNRGQASKQDLGRILDIVQKAPLRSSLYVVHLPDAIYHPKTYVAERPGRVAALVGSPNFTVAAATRHVETAVILESDHREPPIDQIAASLMPAQTDLLPNAYRVAGVDDLDELAHIGVIGVQRPAPPPSPPTLVGRGRAARRRGRFPAAGLIAGTPPPTAKPAGAVLLPAPPPAAAPAPAPPAARRVAFQFAANDLKLTGTREFSVPAGVREWIAQITGSPVASGQGDLLRVNLYARLASAPNAVFESPEQVRIWASGATGGTHFDVRFVIGNHVKLELDRESTLLYGEGLGGGDIGVLELPADPINQPVRLTVVRPADPSHAGLDAILTTSGTQKKRQAVGDLVPAPPPWPY
jgi:hypothetical protein